MRILSILWFIVFAVLALGSLCLGSIEGFLLYGAFAAAPVIAWISFATDDKNDIPDIWD